MLIEDTELPIKIDFEVDEEGLRGTIDIPQLGAKELALANISFKSSEIRFEINALGAAFFGELRDDRISGVLLLLGVFGTFELERGATK